MSQMPSGGSGIQCYGASMPEAAENIAPLTFRGDKSERESSIKEKKLSTGSLGGSSDGVRPKMVNIMFIKLFLPLYPYIEPEIVSLS